MPLKNQLHVSQLLSNVSLKYKSEDYIADKVFPIVPVMKDTDLHRVYVRNWRVPDTIRNSKGLANEFSFEVTTASYVLVEHALKDYVSDDDADNYDLSSLKEDATEELTDALLRRRELSVAQLFTKTSWSLTVSLASGAEFTANTTTSNPIPVFDTAATTIIQNGGMRPNFGILPRNGFVGAKNHVSVLDRTKYTSKEMTANMLAALFDLPELLVPIGSYDSSAQGATESIGNIWDENAFVGYKPSSPGPRQASSGYIFKKNIPAVREWRDEERKSTVVEVQYKEQAKVVASLSGYLICNVS
jgi:hypothetical protein